jgi:hypothetical protein
MILQARRTVDAAQAVVAARLARYLGSAALDAAACAAIADQAPVLVRAGVAGITKQVSVRALEPVQYADRVVIPIRWIATGVSGELYPTLDANIEIRRDQAARTEIVLIGSYQPPFGQTGAVLDRLVMHRIAHRTMSMFLDTISQMITSPDPVVERRSRRQIIPGLGLEPNT